MTTPEKPIYPHQLAPLVKACYPRQYDVQFVEIHVRENVERMRDHEAFLRESLSPREAAHYLFESMRSREEGHSAHAIAAWILTNSLLVTKWSEEDKRYFLDLGLTLKIAQLDVAYRSEAAVSSYFNDPIDQNRLNNIALQRKKYIDIQDKLKPASASPRQQRR